VTISVVLCTAGRPRDLAATLDSLARVVPPAGVEAELVIVDNGGGDEARGVLASHQPGVLPARAVAEPRRGLSRARNRGVAESRGRVVVFIDDDVRPDDGWLAALAARLAPHLLRPWMTPRHRAWLASTERLDFGNVRDLIGANMAVAREVFDRVPGFDPELGAGALGFGEESLFALQMLDAGYRLAGAPQAVVEHHFDPSRLSRASWLQSARRRGEKAAYIAHHWEGRSDDGAALGRWLAAARLLYGRARRVGDVVREEGCASWEMVLVKQLHYWRALRRLRGVPRKYRPSPTRHVHAEAV
jgi:glycosyltransferase involved in cell wall biosynthesis